MFNLSIYSKITQVGAEGIRFDFCDGLRVQLPDGDSKYRVMMLDMDSGIIHYNETVAAGTCVASKVKFYTRWEVDVFKDGVESPVFKHCFNLADKNVLVVLDGALGDMLAWFSSCPSFQAQNLCNMFVLAPMPIADLFRKDYPSIRFVTEEEANGIDFYACFRMGVWFGEDALEHCPRMRENTPLHEQGASILGLAKSGCLHLDAIKPYSRQRKYVCIATKASAQCKFWNNRHGWGEVIDRLHDHGYDVCCIDRETEYGAGIVMNEMPSGCIDWTGELPLTERAAQIKGADFFIGLSSGLSWLAWLCKKPVVLISGFSEPCSEFFTPYRVQNTRVCHGCWNDSACKFDHNDFFWCPRKPGVGEKYECTRAITGRMVVRMIERVLGDLSL